MVTFLFVPGIVQEIFLGRGIWQICNKQVGSDLAHIPVQVKPMKSPGTSFAH